MREEALEGVVGVHIAFDKNGVDLAVRTVLVKRLLQILDYLLSRRRNLRRSARHITVIIALLAITPHPFASLFFLSSCGSLRFFCSALSFKAFFFFFSLLDSQQINQAKQSNKQTKQKPTLLFSLFRFFNSIYLNDTRK